VFFFFFLTNSFIALFQIDNNNWKKDKEGA